MTKFIPILILDEDDTKTSKSFSVRDLLEEIDFHINNVDGATYDNIYLNITTHEYETDDGWDEMIGEVQFSIEKP